MVELTKGSSDGWGEAKFLPPSKPEVQQLKILAISERTCVRTLKQLLALSYRNDIHLVTKRVADYPSLKTTTYYNGSIQGLTNALTLYSDVDVVYAASEPAWVVMEIRRVMPKKKIVLDIHDAQIWRTPDPRYQSAEERASFAWADAVVVPSSPCKRILSPKQPCLVLPPYVNEDFYPDIPWARKGGIVYQGRVDVPTNPSFMDYSKMEKLAKAFGDAGIPFHLYCPKSASYPELKKIYEKIAIWHTGLSYENLIMAMGFHDWGLCGNLDKFREWDIAMPNKLFEYIAGGIPVIALNARETGKFVEKHGIGISVKTIDEIKERWDEREQCQRNVFLKRFNFTMEKHIHGLERLLESVL